MQNAECKMQNLGFSRRGDRSPAGCVEVKLNDGCANKLRQALPHGEGAAKGGGRGLREQIFRSLQPLCSFFSSAKKEPKKLS